MLFVPGEREPSWRALAGFLNREARFTCALAFGARNRAGENQNVIGMSENGIGIADHSARSIRAGLLGLAIELRQRDHGHLELTREELEALRAALAKNNRVLWIIPAIKPRIKEIVYAVATAWEDDILEINGLSSDGVHPTRKGYRALAEHIK